jgi:hypothetical protein
MSFLPSVVSAEYRGGFQIRLTFNDGAVATIDFSQWLEGPIFEPLHDVTYFQRFFVEGGTVSWPNGADIAPETLYEVVAREKRSNKALQPTRVGPLSRHPSSTRTQKTRTRSRT